MADYYQDFLVFLRNNSNNSKDDFLKYYIENYDNFFDYSDEQVKLEQFDSKYSFTILEYKNDFTDLNTSICSIKPHFTFIYPIVHVTVMFDLSKSMFTSTNDGYMKFDKGVSILGKLLEQSIQPFPNLTIEEKIQQKIIFSVIGFNVNKFHVITRGQILSNVDFKETYDKIILQINEVINDNEAEEIYKLDEKSFFDVLRTGITSISLCDSYNYDVCNNLVVLSDFDFPIEDCAYMDKLMNLLRFWSISSSFIHVKSPEDSLPELLSLNDHGNEEQLQFISRTTGGSYISTLDLNYLNKRFYFGYDFDDSFDFNNHSNNDWVVVSCFGEKQFNISPLVLTLTLLNMGYFISCVTSCKEQKIEIELLLHWRSDIVFKATVIMKSIGDTRRSSMSLYALYSKLNFPRQPPLDILLIQSKIILNLVSCTDALCHFKQYSAIPDYLCNGLKSMLTQNDQPSDKMNDSFVRFWKSMLNLDQIYCMHKLTATILLEHDYPFPEYLCKPDPVSKRYNSILCRESLVQLGELIHKKFCSFIVKENNTYIKFLSNADADKTDISSFCVIKMKINGLEVNMGLHFFIYTPEKIRQDFVNELISSIKDLKFLPRGKQARPRHTSSQGAIRKMEHLPPQQRSWEQINCCNILTSNLTQLIAKYNPIRSFEAGTGRVSRQIKLNPSYSYLHKLFFHKFKIWNITEAYMKNIYECLIKIRLQEGFHFGCSDSGSGFLNLIREIDVKRNDGSIHRSLIQYLMYPDNSRYRQDSDNLSCIDDLTNTPGTSQDRRRIYVEVFVENKTGSIVNCEPEIEHWSGKQPGGIAQLIFELDGKCVETFVTLEGFKIYPINVQKSNVKPNICSTVNKSLQVLCTFPLFRSEELNDFIIINNIFLELLDKYLKFHDFSIIDITKTESNNFNKFVQTMDLYPYKSENILWNCYYYNRDESFIVLMIPQKDYLAIFFEKKELLGFLYGMSVKHLSFLLEDRWTLKIPKSKIVEFPISIEQSIEKCSNDKKKPKSLERELFMSSSGNSSIKTGNSKKDNPFQIELKSISKLLIESVQKLDSIYLLSFIAGIHRNIRENNHLTHEDLDKVFNSYCSDLSHFCVDATEFINTVCRHCFDVTNDTQNTTRTLAELTREVNKDCCELKPGLHRRIVRRIRIIMSKYFKEIPGFHQILIYCPEKDLNPNVLVNSTRRRSESEKNYDDLSLKEFDNDYADADDGDSSERLPGFIRQKSLDFNNSMFDVEHFNDALSDAVDMESVSSFLGLSQTQHIDYPLFISINYSIKYANRQHLQMNEIKVVPTCLADFLGYFTQLFDTNSSNDDLDLSKIQYNFDMIPITFIDEEMHSLLNKNKIGETGNNTNNNPIGNINSGVINNNNMNNDRPSLVVEANPSSRLCASGIAKRYLNQVQIEVLKNCKRELIWVLQDEIVASLKFICCIGPSHINQVKQHIEQSLPIVKSTNLAQQICREEFPLDFVFDYDRSKQMFAEKLIATVILCDEGPHNAFGFQEIGGLFCLYRKLRMNTPGPPMDDNSLDYLLNCNVGGISSTAAALLLDGPSLPLSVGDLRLGDSFSSNSGLDLLATVSTGIVTGAASLNNSNSAAAVAAILDSRKLRRRCYSESNLKDLPISVNAQSKDDSEICFNFDKSVLKTIQDETKLVDSQWDKSFNTPATNLMHQQQHQNPIQNCPHHPQHLYYPPIRSLTPNLRLISQVNYPNTTATNNNTTSSNVQLKSPLSYVNSPSTMYKFVGQIPPRRHKSGEASSTQFFRSDTPIFPTTGMCPYCSYGYPLSAMAATTGFVSQPPRHSSFNAVNGNIVTARHPIKFHRSNTTANAQQLHQQPHHNTSAITTATNNERMSIAAPSSKGYDADSSRVSDIEDIDNLSNITSSGVCCHERLALCSGVTTHLPKLKSIPGGVEMSTDALTTLNNNSSINNNCVHNDAKYFPNMHNEIAPFWLLVQLDDEQKKCWLNFHHTDNCRKSNATTRQHNTLSSTSEDNNTTNNTTDERTCEHCDLFNKQIKQHLYRCIRQVNQQLLLKDLVSTRMCRDIFVKPAIGSVHNDSSLHQLTNHNAEYDYDYDYNDATSTTNTSSYPNKSSNSLKFKQGEFACERLYRIMFKLHDRLKSPQSIASTVLLRSSLENNAVLNRKDMLVFVDDDTQAIFYSIISELIQHKLSRDSYSQLIESGVLKFYDSYGCNTVIDDNMTQPVDLIELSLYGMDRLSDKTIDYIIEQIGSKLDSLVLTNLLDSISRSTAVWLNRDDISFLLADNWLNKHKPSIKIRWKLPNSLLNGRLGEFCYYLKQNLMLTFIVPKLADPSDYRHFNSQEIFLFNQPKGQGVANELIFLFSLCLSDSKHEPIKINCDAKKCLSLCELTAEDLKSLLQDNVIEEIVQDNNTSGDNCNAGVYIDVDLWYRGHSTLDLMKKQICQCLMYSVNDLIIELVALERNCLDIYTNQLWNCIDELTAQFKHPIIKLRELQLFSDYNVENVLWDVEDNLEREQLKLQCFAWCGVTRKWIDWSRDLSVIDNPMDVKTKKSTRKFILIGRINFPGSLNVLGVTTTSSSTTVDENVSTCASVLSRKMELIRPCSTSGMEVEHDIDMNSITSQLSLGNVSSIYQTANIRTLLRHMPYEKQSNNQGLGIPQFCQVEVSDNFTVPRQTLCAIKIDGTNIKVFTYNSSKEITDKLYNILDFQVSYHRKRHQFLNSIIYQKLGLFHEGNSYTKYYLSNKNSSQPNSRNNSTINNTTQNNIANIKSTSRFTGLKISQFTSPNTNSSLSLGHNNSPFNANQSQIFDYNKKNHIPVNISLAHQLLYIPKYKQKSPLISNTLSSTTGSAFSNPTASINSTGNQSAFNAIVHNNTNTPDNPSILRERKSSGSPRSFSPTYQASVANRRRSVIRPANKRSTNATGFNSSNSNTNASKFNKFHINIGRIYQDIDAIPSLSHSSVLVTEENITNTNSPPFASPSSASSQAVDSIYHQIMQFINLYDQQDKYRDFETKIQQTVSTSLQENRSDLNVNDQMDPSELLYHIKNSCRLFHSVCCPIFVVPEVRQVHLDMKLTGTIQSIDDKTIEDSTNQDWIQETFAKLIERYGEYLRETYSFETIVAPSMNKNYTLYQKYHRHQNSDVLMIEVFLLKECICVRLLLLEKRRIRHYMLDRKPAYNVYSHLNDISFIHEVCKMCEMTHINSFVYNFYVDMAMKHIEHPRHMQFDVMSFLRDILKIYDCPPMYATSHLYWWSLPIETEIINAKTLFEFLVRYSGEYNFMLSHPFDRDNVDTEDVYLYNIIKSSNDATSLFSHMSIPTLGVHGGCSVTSNPSVVSLSSTVSTATGSTLNDGAAVPSTTHQQQQAQHKVIITQQQNYSLSTSPLDNYYYGSDMHHQHQSQSGTVISQPIQEYSTIFCLSTTRSSILPSKSLAAAGHSPITLQNTTPISDNTTNKLTLPQSTPGPIHSSSSSCMTNCFDLLVLTQANHQLFPLPALRWLPKSLHKPSQQQEEQSAKKLSLLPHRTQLPNVNWLANTQIVGDSTKLHHPQITFDFRTIIPLQLPLLNVLKCRLQQYMETNTAKINKAIIECHKDLLWYKIFHQTQHQHQPSTTYIGPPTNYLSPNPHGSCEPPVISLMGLSFEEFRELINFAEVVDILDIDNRLRHSMKLAANYLRELHQHFSKFSQDCSTLLYEDRVSPLNFATTLQNNGTAEWPSSKSSNDDSPTWDRNDSDVILYSHLVIMSKKTKDGFLLLSRTQRHTSNEKSFDSSNSTLDASQDIVLKAIFRALEPNKLTTSTVSTSTQPTSTTTATNFPDTILNKETRYFNSSLKDITVMLVEAAAFFIWRQLSIKSFSNSSLSNNVNPTAATSLSLAASNSMMASANLFDYK